MEGYWQTEEAVSKEAGRLKNLGCQNFRIVVEFKKLYEGGGIFHVKWSSRYCLYTSKGMRDLEKSFVQRDLLAKKDTDPLYKEKYLLVMEDYAVEASSQDDL